MFPYSNNNMNNYMAFTFFRLSELEDRKVKLMALKVSIGFKHVKF